MVRVKRTLQHMSTHDMEAWTEDSNQEWEARTKNDVRRVAWAVPNDFFSQQRDGGQMKDEKDRSARMGTRHVLE